MMEVEIIHVLYKVHQDRHVISVLHILFLIRKCLRSKNGKLFPKLSSNSVAQWVRGFTTDLQVTSSNPAEAFVIFTFSKNFKTYFFGLIM